MKNTLPPLFFILFLPLCLHAQPMPCGEPAAMTSFCDEACIICDIDGFTGINDSNVQGQAPPGFCTTQMHHMQWIAFIAGTTDLTLQVQVFNCEQGEGLEIGIYETDDCENFTLVSNCDTDVGNNTFGTFTNTVPLTVGQHYFFVMDGSNDDVCNYTINVVNGSTAVPPLSTSGVIEGDFDVCPGLTLEYFTQGDTGAALYDWTLNSAHIGSEQTLEWTWGAPGTYQLCVTASNACDEAPPICQTVTVTAIPPTMISESICGLDCLEFADTILCDPGEYEFHFLTTEGCDSVVHLTLSLFQPFVTDLDLNICEGDTIFIGGNPYFQSGQFTEELTTVQGCDSIVNLNLNVIICEIEAEISAGQITCKGASNGSLTFFVEDGTPPFNYTWERVGQSFPSGQGTLNGVNLAETIDALPPGTYLITITDLFGNDVVLLADITEPPALAVSATFSGYNGFNVSCAGGADGSLIAIPSGGTATYGFLWENGSDQAVQQNLSAGQYIVTVIDAAGCSTTGTFLLTEPEPLNIAATFTDPNCDGLETGSAQAETATGGVPPYLYKLTGSDFSDEKSFQNLSQGDTLTVVDANGCFADTTGSLVAAAIPVIDLGEDLTVELAESARLHVAYNVPLQNINWSPPTGLSCADCLEPDAMPYHTTTYTLTVSSADSCTTSDSVTVHVLIKRDVFIPNAFSPNSDGINDLFTVFGGGEVLRVKQFNVFSRWGSLIYEQADFPANQVGTGWDGTFKGKEMGPGVFAWFAEIEFVDGAVVLYEGDVMVVR